MNETIGLILGHWGPNPKLPWSELGPRRCPSIARQTNSSTWVCTLKKGHTGVHRGGYDDDYWGAEWTTYPKELLFPEGV